MHTEHYAVQGRVFYTGYDAASDMWAVWTWDNGTVEFVLWSYSSIDYLDIKSAAINYMRHTCQLMGA